jgi:hypothetical protein
MDDIDATDEREPEIPSYETDGPYDYGSHKRG